MANTESDIRTAVVNAIKGIYSTLGFDTSPGNINEYLLDEELGEDLVTYLHALVSSKNRVRAWGVQCYSRETYTAVREIPTRVYDIHVIGYYGAHGATPINTLISHTLLVRKAIYDLNLRLGGQVDMVTDVSDLNIKRRNFPDIEVEVFEGTTIYRAEKYNPAWS